jgi:anthranilate synthase component 2
MIILIDNYDSFTYNLYQALLLAGASVKVLRNDALSCDEVLTTEGLSGIVVSPGPGHPLDAGICIELIKQVKGKVPLLGVCLGHQAIGVAFGGTVDLADTVMHGKASLVFHNRGRLFHKVHLPFSAARYHSLVVKKPNFPAVLKIEAEAADGTIMALSHRDYPIYGVQFHPESILTPEGQQIINNFVSICNA